MHKRQISKEMLSGGIRSPPAGRTVWTRERRAETDRRRGSDRGGNNESAFVQTTPTRSTFSSNVLFPLKSKPIGEEVDHRVIYL